MSVSSTVKILLFKLIRLYQIVKILVQVIFELANKINKIYLHFYLVSFYF